MVCVPGVSVRVNEPPVPMSPSRLDVQRPVAVMFPCSGSWQVPAKLIVYEGFGGIGHGPSKPKSHRATMEHNIEWFDQYLFQTAAKPSTEQR